MFGCLDPYGGYLAFGALEARLLSTTEVVGCLRSLVVARLLGVRAAVTRDPSTGILRSFGPWNQNVGLWGP